MPHILVRRLSQAIVDRLKKRARINGRSLQQEVRDILERAATTLTTDVGRRRHKVPFSVMTAPQRLGKLECAPWGGQGSGC
jgi:plasmid stability protein